MNIPELNLPKELRIERLDSRGRGVAQYGDLSLSCDGALPQELIRLHGYQLRRGAAVAQSFEILTFSETRTDPRCSHFGECGGCQIQHIQHTAQLRYKQGQLVQTLVKYGNVSPRQWLPTLADSPFHYRRRVRLGVRMLPNGEVLLGFHRRHHFYLLDISTCSVLEPRLNSLLGPLHQVLVRLSVRHRLPQIEMACGDEGVAVVFHHLLPMTQDDLVLLGEFVKAYQVLVYTQAAGPDSLRLIDSEPPGCLQYYISRHRLRLDFGVTDFIQANARVNQLLIDQVLSVLNVQPHDKILDMFCGVGNFSLALARYAGAVTGVEGQPTLVAKARQNAYANGLDNVEFIQADLRTWSLPVIYNKFLLDPPREGAIDLIKRLSDNAEMIVYVSCLPRTLARDARYLVHHRGFTLMQAGLVDMFPQTKHIEAVALFQRQ